MKTIETPLTAILIVLFLVFATNNYVNQIKLEEERSEKAIELAKQAEEDAKAEEARITEEEARLEERDSRTIRFVITHDSDPDTKTYPVTISSTASDDPGDEINYLWEQINGNEVQIDVRGVMLQWNYMVYD